jgi:hypothetical protein
MAMFTESAGLRGAEFIDADPRLSNGESFLRINGVDVIPLVEAELNQRFPGRADRRATDPDGLRAAWAMLERSWTATPKRVSAMPAGAIDISVAASGRSRRRCGTWSWPPMRGLVGRSWRSSSRSTPSVSRARAPRRTAWTCRFSRRSARRTAKCSRPGRVA